MLLQIFADGRGRFDSSDTTRYVMENAARTKAFAPPQKFSLLPEVAAALLILRFYAPLSVTGKPSTSGKNYALRTAVVSTE